jgi:hypothetical protein
MYNINKECVRIYFITQKLKYITYIYLLQPQFCEDNYSYVTISLVDNVLKAPLNIHRLLERLGIEVLKRVEASSVVLLLTTLGSNQPSQALRGTSNASFKERFLPIFM